ncbi:MAG: efflux RND transporter periplasmic adaptor subunit [Muribaculaceae bacterium]|nr:efflux RND transporter periplasmic adaptor subunit [Muribaculaceae bacterium]MDE6703494.1 efflux RND transporter periplasmic adaptor subunit [Muribaculaceae bacterium]
MATNDTSNAKKTERSLLLTMGIVIVVVAIIAIIGFVFMNKPADIIEGQAEGTTVRISGKLPGRVVEFFVEEGDTVHAGDTLVHIHSSVVDAQLTQAEAMQEVAEAQNRKVDAGTRSQIVKAAYDLLQQANAAVTITEKTYRRMENLYNEGVMSEQKRDEAKAAYDAAVAAKGAAESQYSLAKAGAQKEDKESTAAMVSAAGGSVAQVEALLEDSYLTAPFDGTIDQIYPQEGELVALGAPIMSLLRKDKRWITFNVREELLNDLTMGKKINVKIPALGMKEIEVEIYYIRDMGSYATWHSTKATGSWDSRTFEIKARPTQEVEGLRPGMSIIYE